MSPLQIEILLHYYSRPTDFRDGDFSASAVRQAIDSFKEAEALVPASHVDRQRTYQLGERGVVFVEHLLELALPERVTTWKMS